MKLALFDIDGTLTASNALDTDCFVRAFDDEFGIVDIPVGWHHYEHSTDRGIAMEVLRRAWEREPTEEELARHRRRFVALLRDREIAPIDGAPEFLEFLRSDGWDIRIITGAWSDSAQVKLDAVGIRGIAVTSCDEFVARPDIVRCALAGETSAVLFGDGTWDFAAARELGLEFIGIGTGRAAHRLRKAGARHVFANYVGRDAILAAITAS